MSDHLSRKELKHDSFRESIEHGAEAVASHSKFFTAAAALVIVAALGALGWRVYSERRNVNASAAFEEAMKVYNARIRAANEPAEPSEVTYLDEATKLQDAATKFSQVAEKFPSTNPGRLAGYYAALSMEGAGRHNQALETLKKIDPGSDLELAALTQHQMAVIYSRTGKPDEAVKILRALADKNSVFVPRPLVLLELARQLSATNPKEASGLYSQIKKEFPDSALAEEATRGLESLPKS